MSPPPPPRPGNLGRGHTGSAPQTSGRGRDRELLALPPEPCGGSRRLGPQAPGVCPEGPRLVPDPQHDRRTKAATEEGLRGETT